VISVVVPVKNSGELLPRLLDAVAAQDADDEVEVICIDSGSTDGTPERARSRGALVHSISSFEFNHGGTRNLGFELSRGEIVVYTVDDVIPVGHDWLRSLTRPIRDDSEIAGTYSRQVARNSAPPYQAYYIDYRYGPEPRVQSASGHGDLSLSNVLFSNVSSAIRRDVLSVNPFASDIVIAEDLEWASRVMLAGHKLAYVPESVVKHSHDYSLRDALKRYFDQGAAADRSFLASDRSKAGSVTGEGMRFVRDEMGWLWREGNRRWIPEAFAHELARFAGYKLGVNHRRVPATVKRRISRTAVYWDE
jgi:rhamnosyltransferase